ncbi:MULTISPECIES: DUF7064 domain-containing protein [Mycobacterium]|uniref:AttH domain-containing protein n=1 Tax=Mycobacterium kiyosense TaxID=2871094 RepID=A0A9P3UYM7_9MYCO|nr:MULTISPECIES: hypothetical protein [Mycobacterium]BDB43973.1 hypothetical protein IWGMT90018_44190 [Mycobacterium kiyosense]BDE15519.1 hypothetical protein MKCMC460_43790 [Mycobacterium sp. 20KCMC460]GLB81057.1 hypothetical protein SRL2020028_03130 [Mycobacterium kiyosense]GLB91823.1 hypothetical protein SRL2020130_46400 [Mycobacterium kiyosense]GLB93538.1 hypothetical protein SRL2020226_03140 [Mycobacterium kiyosense]
MDANHPTFPEIDGWSETRWIGTWSPESQCGLWLHVGRCREDLDLWWVQTNVYLPGGRLIVSRSWCRTGQGPLVLDGNLRLSTDEEFQRFSLAFDGAGELCTTAELAEKTAGAGIAVPFRVELSAEAAAPPFDPFGGHGNGEAWASRHTQQTYTTTGTVTFEGTSLELDGVGYIDHSSGPRSFAGVGSHVFVNAVLPDMSVHAMAVRGHDGEQQMVAGAVFTDSAESKIVAVDMPNLTDLVGGPHSFQLRIDSVDGQSTTLDVEIIHTLPVTITDRNDNLNGIGWDLPEDTLILTECVARVTAADGSVGYGQVERSMRRKDYLS